MLQVRDLMSREVATLGRQATAAEALGICRERRVRHIPILDDGRLVGIVSDRDLRDASPAAGDVEEQKKTLEEVRVEDLMSQNVVTAHPQDPVGYAAQEMYEKRINALPVVTEESLQLEGSAAREEGLIGIVTSTDVMRALVMLTGVHESGSQIEVLAPDKPGILAEVAHEIGELGEDIVSALTSPQKRAGNRTMIFRLQTTDPSTVVQSLQMAGYSASYVTVPKRPPRS